MASTISSLLRIELMANGEKNSTWGDITNSNLENVLEAAIAGIATVTPPKTLSVANNSPDEARCAIIVATGTLTQEEKLTIPTSSKTYIVRNNTSGDFAITIGTSGGTPAVIPNGSVLPVFCDGTDTYAMLDTGLLDAIALSLSTKAPINNPTFTGTVGGITKGMVGLGNVDNTSDADKPVSTAQQTALNLKAPLAGPTFTGTPAAPTAAQGTNTTQVATTAFVNAEIVADVPALIPSAIHAAAGKTTPVDADEIPLSDSATSFGLKKLTWANLKATILAAVKTYFGATGTAPVFACRAFVNFTGTGTPTIVGSGNIASITDRGTGRYTVTFTVAMPDANYCVVTSGGMYLGTEVDEPMQGPATDTYTVNGFNISTGTGSQTPADWGIVCAAVFR